MRLFIASFAVLATLRLDPCGGGGAGGAGGANGVPANNGVGAAAAKLCSIFYDGWAYDTATSYEPGKDPIVSSASGTADFHRDGTYKLDYFLGTFANTFVGTYTVDGDKLHLVDAAGKQVFDFSATCGADTKELVLTVKNADGSPSLIYGLHARK